MLSGEEERDFFFFWGGGRVGWGLMFGLSCLLDCGGDVKGNIDSRIPPEDAKLK